MPWIRMGEWRHSFIIFDLGATWTWVVRFKHQLLYPRRKSPQGPLERRLWGPQSRSGSCGIDTNRLPLPWIESRPPASRYIDWDIQDRNNNNNNNNKTEIKVWWYGQWQILGISERHVFFFLPFFSLPIRMIYREWDGGLRDEDMKERNFPQRLNLCILRFFLSLTSSI
jgi:hypothetical protein